MSAIQRWTRILLPALLVGQAVSLWAQDLDPYALVERLHDYPHAVSIDSRELEVADHELGLGALQKIRGQWGFSRSVRLDGTLTRETWQIVDGFAATEVLRELEQQLAAAKGSELLFSCDGRACGNAAQWANRVFGQRVLYGTSGEQRYRAYAVDTEAGEFRLALYSGARTSDRQYLHMDILRLR
ncbi:DUF4892 domain-containing protein [Kineobactrum salinum]|uniref:DUF4892 domain-containing protein n=1 Tax=Kineobactrum salinum TaxID=2708301 RepID=UPI001E350402|nr:DUF4892 domain-containing protein [Kineobactrum salinum]